VIKIIRKDSRNQPKDSEKSGEGDDYFSLHVLTFLLACGFIH